MPDSESLLRTVEDYLLSGYEVRRFEAKGPGALADKRFVATVARAAMAMGNLRDGGLVCIGIDDEDLIALRPGLDAEQLTQWSRYDDVADQLARYSAPPVTFALSVLTLRSGAKVVVLVVEEFDSDLHVCKKDMPGVLQAGQTYVRPRGKPQSAQVPNSTEMRELHNLAIDKGVREFIRRASAAGLFAAGSPAAATSPEDVERAEYEAEQDTAWKAPNPISEPDPRTLVAGVVSPAFTDVAIRPSRYNAVRLQLSELPRFIEAQTVSLRGWPVPMLSYRDPIKRYEDWIAQDLHAEVVPHAEAWRLFTSGQFLHRRVVATDLRDAADLKAESPEATGAIAVWDVLLYMVEVAELGARMATALEVDAITFDFALRNVTGRELISGDPVRRSSSTYITQASDLADTLTLGTPDLVAAPRQHGVELAQRILRKFGASISDQTLFDWQAQVLSDS